MEETYKEHYIHSDAQELSVGKVWKPTVNVFWMEGSDRRSKSFWQGHFNRSFPTKQAAEMEGHLFAKKWIDDGKPNLEP